MLFYTEIFEQMKWWQIYAFYEIVYTILSIGNQSYIISNSRYMN